MLEKSALALIWGYQRYLSPRKGYACAYRVVHGGTGCSGFAKYAHVQHGFWKAMPLIRKRFADCKQAAQNMSVTDQGNGPPNRPRKRRRRWSDYCDCSACCDLPCRAGSRSPNDPSLDCTPDCTPDCAPDCCSL